MIFGSGAGRPAPAPSTPSAAPDARDPLVAWAESFLANAPVPVMIIERADNRLIYANPAFRRLHFMPSTPREVPFTELFDAPAARQIEALVDNVVSMPAK